jgi:4-hydroxyproline epimerase
MQSEQPQQIHAIDSHTEGEPTRLVIEGGPELGSGSLLDRRERFRKSHDWFRRAVVLEPRGADCLVGALLCEPCDPQNTAGVIFFNNTGYLSMCGHGTIGLIASLAHLGRIDPGAHRIETPVGVVTGFLHEDGMVTLENVASFRSRKDVVVDVPGIGEVRGDIAWGGNWFFLVEDHVHQLSLEFADQLTEYAWKIRQALNTNGITGADGAEIDHVELFSAVAPEGAHGRNFVLCPGKEYDRSPCGTGTSAKLACLYADGKLSPGQVWRQQGILGTVFEGNVAISGDKIIPSITGSAFVTAETRLYLDPRDPFRAGINRWI